MGRLLFVILLTLAGLQASAADSLTHQSVVVYKFNQFSVILVSRPITDSLLDIPGTTRNKPVNQRDIILYDQYLRIYVTTSKEPFLQPVRTVSYIGSTDAQDGVLAEDLEVQLTYLDVGQPGSWREIKGLPLLKKDSPISYFPMSNEKLPVTNGNYYRVLERMIAVYVVFEVKIRNKITQEEIIRFRFRAYGDPITPFLIQETQEASNKKLIDSFLKVRENLTTMPNVEFRDGKFVQKESTNKRVLTRILHNELLYKTSELVMYFEKQRDDFPDSSMEFRLLSRSTNDTNWIKTGHRLVIPQLVAGTNYKMQVRYELHPTYIQEHTFHVAPEWYRTTQAIILYICILILAGLLSWLLIYRRKLSSSRRRREQASLEIKAIRSQLNPHFVFNALSSIQGLINKNDIPAANHYLTEFSSLLRDALHNSEKEMVALVSELHLLDTYLKLEQLRFNFNYQINIDPTIDKNGTELPNLLLQPLVENAVKHGVATLGEKGFIKIDIIKKDLDLLVFIIDNGHKFDENRANGGYGLKLTRNRIALLGQTLKEQPIELTLERSPDKQTIVHLVFKNWL